MSDIRTGNRIGIRHAFGRGVAGSNSVYEEVVKITGQEDESNPMQSPRPGLASLVPYMSYIDRARKIVNLNDDPHPCAGISAHVALLVLFLGTGRPCARPRSVANGELGKVNADVVKRFLARLHVEAMDRHRGDGRRDTGAVPHTVRACRVVGTTRCGGAAGTIASNHSYIHLRDVCMVVDACHTNQKWGVQNTKAP